jgi:hypothetical protein
MAGAVGPMPGQELVDPVDRVIGDAGEDVTQVGFGVDAVQFAGFDQAVFGWSSDSARAFAKSLFGTGITEEDDFIPKIGGTPAQVRFAKASCSLLA